MLKADEIKRYLDEAEKWDSRADGIDNCTYGGIVGMPYEEKLKLRKKADVFRTVAGKIREVLQKKLERGLNGKS